MIINKLDNVEINLEDGHKYAARDIKTGENIIKYGNPIGHAICDIKCGEHIHSHNMKTNLSGNLEYQYNPQYYSRMGRYPITTPGNLIYDNIIAKIFA